MLSLNDAFSEEELYDWEKRIKKLLPPPPKGREAGGEGLDYFCEVKFDGLAVSLVYKNGEFVQGATRGDGFVGEDITQNLKTIESIPLSLARRGVRSEVNSFPEYLEIRGEALISKKTLISLNKKNAKEDKPRFANTRNVAAGSLRQLDLSWWQKES